MSFGINGPENLPAIQKSHHTNDGGAGNLGYFQQERKNKKDNEDSLMEDLDSIGTRIKNFWLSLHNKEEKNPEET